MSVIVDIAKRREQVCYAFEYLLSEHHIVGTPCAACCQSCAGREVVDSLEDDDIGYCFWHEQDEARLRSSGRFHLSFGTGDGDADGDVKIGHLIVDTLGKFGIETKWTGRVSDRIEVVL